VNQYRELGSANPNSPRCDSWATGRRFSRPAATRPPSSRALGREAGRQEGRQMVRSIGATEAHTDRLSRIPNRIHVGAASVDAGDSSVATTDAVDVPIDQYHRALAARITGAPSQTRLCSPTGKRCRSGMPSARSRVAGGERRRGAGDGTGVYTDGEIVGLENLASCVTSDLAVSRAVAAPRDVSPPRVVLPEE
jgi:hypothetical protein